jgi:hypothetical protein
MKALTARLCIGVAIALLSACASTPMAPPPHAAESPPVVARVESVQPPHAEAAMAAPSLSEPSARMPDSDKTPGNASYRTVDQICVKGSAKDERNVSEAAKREVYESYGIEKCKGYCSGKQGCEIDHLISIELGGANTEDNLWPQPYDGDWNAHDKDRLENKLHQMVCVDKSVTLKGRAEGDQDGLGRGVQRVRGEKETV